jgi:general stress protein CsbA
VIQRLLTHIAWPVRVLWIAFALAPNGFGVVAWILWAVVAIGTWIHHPISLTTVRCLAPIVVFYSAMYALSESFNSLNIAVVTCGIISLMLMFTADYGSAHVQAGAYGNERRFLLRIPAPVVLPTLITWALFATVLVVLESAVQSENYVLGIPLLLALIAMSWKFAPQMHRLSKRWLVRVPAGWVVHDDLLLAENLLVRSHNLVAINFALADSEALDLSGMTRGVPIQISLREMTDVRLSQLGARLLKTMDVLHVQAFLVATTRTPLN